MIKKIILGLCLVFGLIGNTFAESQAEMEAKAKAQSAQSVLNSATQNYNDAKAEQDTISQYDTDEQKKARDERLKNSPEAKAMQDAQNNVSEANSNLHKTQCGEGGSKAGKCLDQPTFMIGVDETLGVGIKVDGKNTSQVINKTLGTVIQKLMVALGVLAVLIMTIGAGYIIMYHGQDELLSKGKSIFMSGITALVVALSSYYLVAILRYILYK